ncbi:MAG TPA: hypothetical protein VFZ21_22490 [Gemmatimonadaceae bacterium]|nr:hypothetical protein [Gemmatimonadaceae bacterium]
MRITNSLLAAALLLAGTAQLSQAQELASTDQTVTMSVSAINQLSFAASVSLTVSTGVIGTNALTPATASSTYGIISNVDSVSVAKISATLDTDMPAGSSLEVSLDAPTTVTGAVAAGKLALSTTSVDLVTNIPAVNESGIPLTYTFTADVNTPASLSRTVHYVLTQGA